MTPYHPTLDWIDSQHPAMVRMVGEWSRINSGSYHLEGLEMMADVLRQAFTQLCCEYQSLPLAPMQMVDARGEIVRKPLGNALRFWKRPAAPLQIFLGGHMDTVFPADHPFQAPVRVDENTINGPGVADLKGGLVVMLTALEALERSPFAEKIGWEIIINPDEEIGSPGSASLWEGVAQRNHFGLIYEPALADGTLAGARKGSGNFTCVIRGKAAHAGREHHLGRNAITALAEYITAINSLNGQREGVTVNPGKIEGGGPVNIVPDLAIGRFNVRVASHEERQWVEEALKGVAEEIARKDGITIDVHGGFGRPPKELSPKNERLFSLLRECGEDIGAPIRWQATGGCCDGNNLAAHGLPNVDSLGVRGGGIHSEREFVLLDSLTERAKLSALLLMKLGAGEVVW